MNMVIVIKVPHTQERLPRELYPHCKIILIQVQQNTWPVNSGMTSVFFKLIGFQQAFIV